MMIPENVCNRATNCIVHMTRIRRNSKNYIVMVLVGNLKCSGRPPKRLRRISATSANPHHHCPCVPVSNPANLRKKLITASGKNRRATQERNTTNSILRLRRMAKLREATQKSMYCFLCNIAYSLYDFYLISLRAYTLNYPILSLCLQRCICRTMVLNFSNNRRAPSRASSFYSAPRLRIFKLC